MDEKAELEAFRAEKKRNELIEVEMRKRSELCHGAIPADQLREIAGRQVDHDAALAKAAALAAPTKAAAPAAAK
jgi:low affinity Fe/Cu permease